MLAALEDLRKARISVMDLLAILGGEYSEFYSHRLAFLSDSGWIRELLDIIWAEKKSRPTVESWVQDVGVNMFSIAQVGSQREVLFQHVAMKCEDLFEVGRGQINLQCIRSH